MNNVEIKVGSVLPIKQLFDLYNSVGWTDYTSTQSENMLETAVRNSTYVVSAWKDNILVGLARGLSDDVSIFYLQHILVQPDLQGMGIGRALLNNCLERFKHVRTKLLLTDDDAQRLKFYESMGFKNTRHLQKIALNAFVQSKGIE